MTANDSSKQKRTKPNRIALKTAHAPKPAHAATKSVASEPLEKIVEYYQELHETSVIPLLPHAVNYLEKQHRGSLKLFHTVETIIEELPKLEQDNRPFVHGIFFAAKLALAA